MEEENEKSQTQRKTLFEHFALRRPDNNSKNYVEIFFIPSVAIIAAAIICIALLMNVLNFGGVTRSTKMREKLTNSSANIEIIDSGENLKSTQYLKEALNEFYNVTGVAPCVYVLAKDEIASAEEMYYQHCANENCFFVVFNTKTDSVNSVVGSAAVQVIDDEAYKIFTDYVEYYVNIVESDEELLEYAFIATANRIMTKTNLFNGVAVQYHFGIIITLVIIAFFGLKVTKNIKNKLKEGQ